AEVLRKCLADDPRERYADAASLANDLRRYLTDLPLRGVANRSPAERWWRWRHRRPYGLGLFVVLFALVAGVGLALAYIAYEGRKARAALAEGQDHLQRRAYGAARTTWQRGLATAENLPFHTKLAEELRGRLRLAERGEAADQLNQFVERLRILYGADGQPLAELRTIEAHCRTIWDQRNLIAQHHDSPEREQVEQDLLDLAILWTDLRVRLAGKAEANNVRKEALKLLGQAEELFGPSCVLECERQAHAAALERLATVAPPAPGPRTPWE